MITIGRALQIKKESERGTPFKEWCQSHMKCSFQTLLMSVNK